MRYGANRELDQQIEEYINRNVGPCQSGLVDALIQTDFDGFGIDDLQGMYADPSDWDADQCYEYADDNGIDLENDPRKMIREALFEVINGDDYDRDAEAEETDDELRERIADDNLEGWKDQVRDWSQDNPNEPLEWWVVDSWLAGKLLEMGEVIIDNDYGYWWGRTCSGQSIALDGTFYRLFESMGWNKGGDK